MAPYGNNPEWLTTPDTFYVPNGSEIAHTVAPFYELDACLSSAATVGQRASANVLKSGYAVNNEIPAWQKIVEAAQLIGHNLIVTRNQALGHKAVNPVPSASYEIPETSATLSLAGPLPGVKPDDGKNNFDMAA